MKIKTAVSLATVVNVTLIVIIAAFAYNDLNRILDKLRFVEIADDMNTSFLEMRLSEKNYFLFDKKADLNDIREHLNRAKQVLTGMRTEITRATGEDHYSELLDGVQAYAAVLPEGQGERPPDAATEARIREAGKRLRETSQTLIRLERNEVSRIIDNSTQGMILSFWAILVSTITISPISSYRIINALKKIERLTRAIAQGEFGKTEEVSERNEIGTVIQAVNTMSQELRDREEELLQTKKMASLGILTAGVAHEITNPLNNISMIAQTYQDAYDDLDEDMRLDLMKKVEQEGERIKNVVVNLLDFSKPKESQRSVVDIREVIRHTMGLVRNMLDVSGVETVLNLEQDLKPVYVDQHQMHQVLVNLITNAIQAMSPGGRLTITARPGPEETVEIEVRDTGKGIPAEHQQHIFDPFFSTKGVDGTGLGLSIIYGTIKNHKGTIRVESEVGKGTAFTISLPVHNVMEV